MGPSTNTTQGDLITQERKRQNEAARTQAYNDALTDRSVDAVTRREIENLYNRGAHSTQIASLLAKAQEGKGLYAIRRVNENLSKVRSDQPGRAQLMSPLSGAGAGPLGGSR